MSTRDELQRLYERDGTLTPAQVVAEATPEASPLHVLFEWNDTEAARQYRLVQATALIIRCRVTIQTAPDTLVKTRAFVHVATEDSVGYVPIAEAMSDERREQVIAQAQRELAMFAQKYRGLVDIAQLFEELLRPPEAA